MALVIGIRYLLGRAVATDVADYQRAEWPPHPARVYMALVAAHAEAPPETESHRQAELEALRWLEELDPPEVAASESDPRGIVTHYVPPNDFESKRQQDALQLIPQFRTNRQPRTFPSVRPREECVYLIWPHAAANGHADALQRLCRRVTRIGHSSSLVQLWLADESPSALPRWIPSNGNSQRRLRICSPGLFDQLAADFDAGIRPSIGTWQGYQRADADGRPLPGTIWQDELLVLAIRPIESHHRWLTLPATLAIARRFREALISNADRAGLLPLPEWISGHQPGGQPTEQPHLAIFPLAFVGREHADGHLLGLGLAIPTQTAVDQRRTLLKLVRQTRELKLGRLGRWHLAELTWEAPPWNLQSAAWTGGDSGARCWGSVTPIVFDRHPKARNRAAAEPQAAASVAQACERIGLPRPATVEILSVSPHLGTPASHEFPRLARKDGAQRQHRHVRLRFDQPVRGPVAIGAGRYRGYGFCRPLREKESQ